jgi:hypothetical protein
MTSLLTTLRQHAPRITARAFLASHPGSFIQYYDDTPVKNPAKAMSARTFDPDTARRKQREGCAVGFSLQPFMERRTKDDLLCYRTLGADVDLIALPERATMSGTAIDARKEEYLHRVLVAFPMRPHWLIETRHGFHLLIRIQPQREPKTIAEAEELNRRFVRALRGDIHATLLTQVLRVPGTLQFKVPPHPFLCRLLLDTSAKIPPYTLGMVRDVLDLWERKEGVRTSTALPSRSRESLSKPLWQQGLAGIAEGQRKATAASLVGKIIDRLPEELWETAGFGGLKEWNGRNALPLPERELRSVFESIARREKSKRKQRMSLARQGDAGSVSSAAHAQY